MLLFPFVLLYPISELFDDSVDIIGVIGTTGTAPLPIPLVKSEADAAVVAVGSPEN